jgi:AraC-like DNA-binding protein/mannose-6-phosphate isomerase-like protein (cupin superfamily)
MATFLTFHNLGSSVSEFIEIGMPYMILYESNKVSEKRMQAIEFTESSQYYFTPEAEEFDQFAVRPLHIHDFYELTVVMSGEVRIQIEDELRVYHEGDCCLCNKNTRHKEFFDTDFEMVLFLFQENYIRKLFEHNVLYDEKGSPYTYNSFFHHLFAQNAKNPFYDSKEYIEFLLQKDFDPDPMLRLVNEMILEISDSKSGKRFLMMGYFCRFIYIIENDEMYVIQVHQAKLSQEEQLMYQIATLLEECHGQIDRETLEARLCYSNDHINRVIKKNTGKTLSEYKKGFLLQEVAKQLKNTTKNIEELCAEFGYSNRTYFNKCFKEVYGVTPAEYRKS